MTVRPFAERRLGEFAQHRSRRAFDDDIGMLPSLRSGTTGTGRAKAAIAASARPMSRADTAASVSPSIP